MDSITNTSTPDLDQQLRNGDEDALAMLFEHHAPRLRQLIGFRMDARLRQRVDEDDILQDIFMAARTRIERFGQDGFTSSFLWLRLVAIQTLTDLYRRHLGAQQRDARREISLDAAASPQATSVCLAHNLIGTFSTPSQKLMRAELFANVQKAIAEMDETAQEILALRHFEELTNSETAAVLNIQPKAASIRYIRALTRLREILNALPDPAREKHA